MMFCGKLSFCVTFLFGLAPSVANAETFSSPNGYSITSSAAWRLDKSGSTGNEVVIYTHKDDEEPKGTPAPNFNVRIGSQGRITLELAKRGLIPFYRKGYPHLVLVSQIYSMLDKKRSLDTTVLVGNPNALIRIRQVLVLRNHQVCFFTSACAEQVHLKYDPIFSQILASVRWKSEIALPSSQRPSQRK